ncbi:MAG: hypothetical protein JWR05_218 [Mucilaginibacter sp.]|nr:hypothetical protein [Mucilaginibacter sp.]
MKPPIYSICLDGKLFCLVLGLLTSTGLLAQDNPTAEYYNFKSTASVIRIYQSKVVDNHVTNEPRLDGITNIWNFNKKFNYYFKKDITVIGSDGQKYVRFTIPAGVRWDPVKKGILIEEDKLKNYDNPAPWIHEADFVDSQDFNSWLWISEVDFNALNQPYYPTFHGTWFFSGITTPFKYRFAAGTHANALVNGDVNLGTIVAWRFINHSGSSGLSIGPFLGVGSLSMTSSNNINSTITSTSNISNFAFNYGGGVVLDVDKKFQMGLLGGFDHATGDLANGYLYQDRMWLGFSFNFKFLDFGTTAKDTQNTSKDKGKAAQ